MKLYDNIVCKELPDTLVLLNVDDGDYFTLNETAAFIVRLINNGKDKSDILSEMKSAYDCDDQEMESDYDSVLSYLKEKKIVMD